MSSPRSMFSGTIQIGPFINIPITIGKATSDEREKSLVEVCDDHPTPQRINRNERCQECAGKPASKRMAVEVNGEYRLLTERDLEEIEEANGGATLTLIDVQSASKLPLLYSQGTYYVRHNDGAKVTPDGMATLAATMMVERLALVVNWKGKLCAITSEQGILVLRILPYKDSVRPASKKERAHMAAKVDARAVSKLGELLREFQNPEGFDYTSQVDERLKRRQAVVDRILSGEKPKRKAPPKKDQEPVDFEKLIDQAIQEVRG